MKPEIRFNGFSDEWNITKLEDVVVESVDKSVTEDQYDVLSSTVNGIELRKGRVSGKSNIGYKILDLNHLVLSPQNLWLGNINVNRLIKGIVSPSYKVYEFNSDRLLSVYASYMLRTARLLNEYKNVSVQGASTVRRSLDLNRFYNIKCELPSLPEQQKIGALFSKYDTIIALREQKLAELNALKEGMLQQMFPKNGAKVPELRFTGFAYDWEERKFEDLLDLKDGVRRGPFGSALKKEFFVENSEYVVYEQQNAIYDNYHTRYKITKEKFDELSKFKLNPGDFIMSGAGTIGRISRVPDDIKLGVFNQALIRFRINPEITDSEYFIQFVRADFMQQKLTGANPGSAIANLVPMSDVKKWEIKVPTLPEQQKIGQLFKHLDDRISNEQAKIEQLKEQKQGLLERMLTN